MALLVASKHYLLPRELIDLLGRLEIASPILHAYEGSSWRSQVQTLCAFLDKHSILSTNRHCSIHVHISVAIGFTLQELKKIAQCIIHFKSAIEALVPPSCRGNEFAKSNWIDNPRFRDPHFSLKASDKNTLKPVEVRIR